MFKTFGKLFLGAAAAAAVASAAPREAGAWLKVHNNTNLTINFAHAFDSMNGQFCGYYDGCDNSQNELDNWRVKGWWVIKKGATATVQSEDYNNAWHQYFAYDSTSTWFWQGGGRTFRTQSSAFSYCGGHALGTPRTFRVLSTYKCCGLVCSGSSNHTLNLNI